MMMYATRQGILRCVALAACATGVAPALATALPGVMAKPILQCRASLGVTDMEWAVELDEAIPLATVDNLDTPAEYSNGHARVRLSASGPNLFIGLASGRLLVTAIDGHALGKGNCKPLISLTTREVVTIAALAGPPKLFHPTPASPAVTAFAA